MKTNYMTIQSLTKYLNTLGANDIVLSDIDETVMTVSREVNGKRQSALGSASWFQHYFLALLKLTSDKSVAKQQAVKVFCLLQQHLQMSLVEPELLDSNVIAFVKAFNAAKQRGVKFVGITLRDGSLVTITKQQLSILGIDFSLPHSVAQFSFSGEDFPRGKVVYDSGIIYCCGNHKGKVLEHIFTNNYVLPRQDYAGKTLHFIDDAKNNCQDVAEVFNGMDPTLPTIKVLFYNKVDEQFAPYKETQDDQTLIGNILALDAVSAGMKV